MVEPLLSVVGATGEDIDMDQAVNDFERTALVPPRRLGRLLSEARSAQGLTLEDLAGRSAGRFSLAALSSIERGSREITDDEARVLSSVYGIESTALVPPRSQLIVDLDEGLLSVEDRRAQLPRLVHSRDEVLTRYLTMVYSMRQLPPGAPLTLRVDDLDVLGEALRVGSGQLTADLEALMANPADLLHHRSRSLRRRVLLPAAGIMVALVGVGALVLVQGQGSADAIPTAPRIEAVSSQSIERGSVAPVVSVDIGSAVVQERSADGSPGPVVVRNGDDDGIDVAPGLIEPATTIR